jgi:hypothetical protein
MRRCIKWRSRAILVVMFTYGGYEAVAAVYLCLLSVSKLNCVRHVLFDCSTNFQESALCECQGETNNTWAS